MSNKVQPFHSFIEKHTGKEEAHPLSLVLTSMSILGVKINCDSSCSLFKDILIKCHMVVILFFFHYWAVTDVIWYFHHPIKEEVLSDSVTIWSSLCTVDFLLLRKRSVCKVLEIVADETRKLNEEDKRKFRNTVRIACAIVWLFVIIFMIQYVIFSSQTEINYFTNSPIYTFYNSLNTSQKMIVVTIDGLVECFFVQGSLTMIIALYILLCCNAKLWFKGFSEYSFQRILSANRDSSNELKDIRLFRSAFEKLSKNVEAIDDLFSMKVAVWITMILVNLCVRILGIFNPKSLTSPEMIFVASLSMVRAGVTLIFVSFAADAVQKAAVNAMGKIDELISEEINTWTSLAYNEVQVAFLKYPCNPVQLTVWKITCLNRSFLVTMGGVMMTYVIICIQMNPTAMQQIKG